MITVNSDNQFLSDAFISKLNSDSRRFRARFLVKGDVLSCDILKITANKGAGKEISPGSVYVPYFKAQITSCDTVLDGRDIVLQIGLVLEETEEYLDFGTFTVIRENRAQGKTEIYGTGFLRSKCSGAISLSAGISIASAIANIQQETGITVSLQGLTATGNIPHALSASCRDALGEIAALLGGFVTEDHASNIVIAKYGSGDTLPVNGDRMLSPPEANNADYEVTGLKVIVSEKSTDEDGETIPESSFVNGQANVVYKSENMTQSQFAIVVQNFVGYEFRPATLDLSLGDPRLEPWDSLVVSDPGGDEYTVPCLEMVFNYDGGLQTSVDASINTDAENETVIQGPYSKAINQLTAQMISANDAILKRATINQLKAENAILDNVIIGSGQASNFSVAKLTFMEAVGDIFTADQLTALSAAFDTATAGTITADNINTARATFESALAGSFTATQIAAASAEFKTAIVEQLYVSRLKADYAEIDFANVTTEAVKNLFVNVGMIENATIHEGRITGTLSGVTVVADVIEANAIVAGDLIVQDAENEGIYYKINPTASGLTTDELESLEYDKFVSGQYIVAKSITADQVAVTELAAFGATIAGLQLENGKIYTAGKSSITSSAPGIYMDNQGQFVTGNDYNFIASWYDTEAQKWKIAIRADEISFGTGESVTEVITNAAAVIYDHTYIMDGTSATFTAVVREGKNEITRDYPPECYTWYLKTEDGTEYLGSGYTMTVDTANCGYGAEVVGKFTETFDDPLLDSSGNELETEDGDTLTGRTETEGRIKVTELPVRAPSITDKLLGIGEQQEYQLTIQDLKDLIGGAIDYSDLQGKPSIEGVELVNNKSFEDLQLSGISNTELENMLII